jgi:hypothetical protein
MLGGVGMPDRIRCLLHILHVLSAHAGSTRKRLYAPRETCQRLDRFVDTVQRAISIENFLIEEMERCLKGWVVACLLHQYFVLEETRCV